SGHAPGSASCRYSIANDSWLNVCASFFGALLSQPIGSSAMRFFPTSAQQRSCCTCPVTILQPSSARSVRKRPSSVKAPMAKFQPPLVDTSAQPSITVQFLIVHGATGSAQKATAKVSCLSMVSQSNFIVNNSNGRHKSDEGRTNVASPSTKPKAAGPRHPENLSAARN